MSDEKINVMKQLAALVPSWVIAHEKTKQAEKELNLARGIVEVKQVITCDEDIERIVQKSKDRSSRLSEANKAKVQAEENERQIYNQLKELTPFRGAWYLLETATGEKLFYLMDGYGQIRAELFEEVMMRMEEDEKA